MKKRIIPNCEYDYDQRLSLEEIDVIYKFLNLYKNREFIIADTFRQEISLVPLEESRVFFKIDEDNGCKSLDFCNRIFHNGKIYVVELGFWRINKSECPFKCLEINNFRICTKDKIHYITLDTKDTTKRDILFNILSIFEEKKIISPEQAYSKQMYTNKALQNFIKNHEWQNIDQGINQMPILADALFIINEGIETNYTADFGTILYQLITFRMNYIEELDDNDLLKLDELILKLSRTKLLKVQLCESVNSEVKTSPTESILLESNNFNIKMHLSKKYNVDNTRLLKEKEELDKCVRKLMKHYYNQM